MKLPQINALEELEDIGRGLLFLGQIAILCFIAVLLFSFPGSMYCLAKYPVGHHHFHALLKFSSIFWGSAFILLGVASLIGKVRGQE